MSTTITKSRIVIDLNSRQYYTTLGCGDSLAQGLYTIEYTSRRSTYDVYFLCIYCKLIGLLVVTNITNREVDTFGLSARSNCTSSNT